jgi:hypothetical protein
MRVGISTQTYPEWVKEFHTACAVLGLPCRLIETRRGDWFEQLLGVDLFVWRVHLGDYDSLAEARAKIPLIEQAGITCFPSTKMLWGYDDKIRQTYLFRQMGVAIPSTFISSDHDDIQVYLRAATYPLVVKSPCGASSSGVSLLASYADAERMVRRVFSKGRGSEWKRLGDRIQRRIVPHRVSAVPPRAHSSTAMYFQEYVPSDGDWRITTVGSRLLSVFRRRNRPNDFRASGSGLWDLVSEKEVPEVSCAIARDISRRQRFTSMAYDFLLKGSKWLLIEMSYTFILNRVYSDTLFSMRQGRFRKEPPVPIGVMLLRALQEEHRRRSAGTPARRRHRNQGGL